MTRRLLPLILAVLALEGQRADIRIDIGLVTVPCSITDRTGAPVKNLRIQDFLLKDNGRTRKIEHLWQESELPLTIGLVVDVSGSQSAFVDRHRETVAQFLTQVLGPEDHAFLVTVAGEVKLLTDLTGSPNELRAGVRAIDPFQRHGTLLGEPCRGQCGGTALWNAVYAAANQKMHWIQGRKALIILSDGMDTGSPHSLPDAVESAQEAETVVYAIKYVDPTLALTRRERSDRSLERLTDLTGGYTFLNPEDQVGSVFARIEKELRSLYVLGFTPPVEARDGRFHKLQVAMVRRGLRVRTRNGYYAALRN